MFDELDWQDLFAAEANPLRAQALDLFDRCLTENDAALMIAFIERQIMQDPPPLQLLHEMDDDLQQRLHALRTNRYDVRSQVVKAVLDSCAVDIAGLMPPDALETYHLLQASQVMHFILTRAPLASQDVLLLGKLLEASIETVARLQLDIQMTAEVHSLLVDWLDALSMSLGRGYGVDAMPVIRSTTVH